MSRQAVDQRVRDARLMQKGRRAVAKGVKVLAFRVKADVAPISREPFRIGVAEATVRSARLEVGKHAFRSAFAEIVYIDEEPERNQLSMQRYEPNGSTILQATRLVKAVPLQHRGRQQMNPAHVIAGEGAPGHFSAISL